MGTPPSDLARGYLCQGVPHLRYPPWTWPGGTPARGTPLRPDQGSGRSKGGTRGRMPPLTQNFFIFMQFLGKIRQIVGWHPLFRVGAPPSGKSWIHHCRGYAPLDLAGGYPCQGCTPPQVPPPLSDLARGYPCQGGTPPRVEYWIRRGRYASCVHTGGLSCLKLIFAFILRVDITVQFAV